MPASQNTNCEEWVQHIAKFNWKSVIKSIHIWIIIIFHLPFPQDSSILHLIFNPNWIECLSGYKRYAVCWECAPLSILIWFICDWMKSSKCCCVHSRFANGFDVTEFRLLFCLLTQIYAIRLINIVCHWIQCVQTHVCGFVSWHEELNRKLLISILSYCMRLLSLQTSIININ